VLAIALQLISNILTCFGADVFGADVSKTFFYFWQQWCLIGEPLAVPMEAARGAHRCASQRRPKEANKFGALLKKICPPEQAL